MTETTAIAAEPLVSILTPVFNGENFLAECIDSVLRQTYHNWRYVIVDNCSTDRSAEIAKQYALQDDRITVYSNEEFLNAIDNQNSAIEHIHPEAKYCKVVHADDWIYPECVMKMVSLAESNPNVGVVSSYWLRERRVDGCGLPVEKSVFEGKEIALDRLNNGLYLFGSPTSLLLRCSVIESNKPLYDPDWTHYDVEACVRMLKHTDFGFVHQVLTYTRTHDTSRTTVISKPAGTDSVDHLRMVVEYGDFFCKTADQYNELVLRQTEAYYNVLGRNIFRLRKKDVRAFHVNNLEKFGHSFRPMRVIYACLCDLVRRPLGFLRTQVGKELSNTWSP